MTLQTGTVLCGIVGKTRFKFDVWSNDVNFANKMESTGKPGQVHISEKTYKFLKDDYLVEEGEILNGKLKSVFSESSTFLKTIFTFLIRFPVILLSDQGAHCRCT